MSNRWAIFDGTALKSLETRRTFNPRVRGSSPCAPTINLLKKRYFFSPRPEIVPSNGLQRTHLRRPHARPRAWVVRRRSARRAHGVVGGRLVSATWPAAITASRQLVRRATVKRVRETRVRRPRSSAEPAPRPPCTRSTSAASVPGAAPPPCGPAWSPTRSPRTGRARCLGEPSTRGLRVSSRVHSIPHVSCDEVGGYAHARGAGRLTASRSP